MSREGKENTKVRAKEVGKKISECFLKIFLAFYLAKYIGNISGFYHDGSLQLQMICFYASN